ncbi:hypothetical protein SDC9_165116 [bioreactor metagenome]|uniref:Uncharacterized protein n=1 Tax=bioreactor metagenome TaxID=1076179 RepID=A0A645FTH5_9ZZZZ
MGNGDTLAEAGRTELFPGEQAVEHRGAGNPVLVLEKNARLFKDPYLAGGFQVQDDVFRREKFSDELHRMIHGDVE